MNQRQYDAVVLGDLVADMVVRVSSLPIQAGRHQLTHNWSVQGGGACNFLIAGARLGLRTASIGYVGDDIFGCYLSNLLASEGVDVAGISFHKELQTIVPVVLVDDAGQHVFLGGFPGHLRSELTQTWQETIAQGRVLMVFGWAFSEFNPTLALNAMTWAQSQDAAVWFDPGPGVDFIAADDMIQALRLTTVLLLTEEEATVITGQTEVRDSAQTLSQRGPELVILKQGERGCLLRTRQDAVHVSAFPVEVRDTVGAGDSFAAGALYGYLRGRPLAEIGRLANAVGAATVRKTGGGANVATRAEVEELLGVTVRPL